MLNIIYLTTSALRFINEEEDDLAQASLYRHGINYASSCGSNDLCLIAHPCVWSVSLPQTTNLGTARLAVFRKRRLVNELLLLGVKPPKFLVCPRLDFFVFI